MTAMGTGDGHSFVSAWNTDFGIALGTDVITVSLIGQIKINDSETGTQWSGEFHVDPVFTASLGSFLRQRSVKHDHDQDHIDPLKDQAIVKELHNKHHQKDTEDEIVQGIIAVSSDHESL